VGDRWLKRSYGARVDLLRVAPSTWRIYLDGKPMNQLHTHKVTAHKVALGIAEALNSEEEK